MRRRDLLSAVGATALATTAAGRTVTTGNRADERRPRATTEHTNRRSADQTDPPTLEPLASLAVERAADVTVDDAGETASVTKRDGVHRELVDERGRD